MKNYDIVAVGESLIDLLATVDEEAIRLTGNAGGGPANLLTAASRLGRKTSYISKIGDDIFGRFFKDYLGRQGVETRWSVDDSAPSTLAIVSLDERGDRDFSFNRNGASDIRLTEGDLNVDLLKDCRIMHFSTVIMTEEPARSANLFAVRTAMEAGALISFDPNYRAFLWPDRDEAKDVTERSLALADLIKLSEEETFLCTGIDDPMEAGKLIFERYNPVFLAVTLGEKGSIGFAKGGIVSQNSYDLGAVDTTGAGDGFWGAALHRILTLTDEGVIEPKGKKGINAGFLRDILAYGNAAGAIATTRKGGMPAMAKEEEIQSLLQE